MRFLVSENKTLKRGTSGLEAWRRSHERACSRAAATHACRNPWLHRELLRPELLLLLSM
jgi:hypothetical protein